MPTFEYRCQNSDCGNTFEHLTLTSGDENIVCPQCGSIARKIFTVSGNFILNGKGWPGKAIKNDRK